MLVSFLVGAVVCGVATLVVGRAIQRRAIDRALLDLSKKSLPRD